jgi:CubicO group peptidase (beta-lactamase class C family)
VTPTGAADPAALFAARAAFVPGSTIQWGLLRDGRTTTGSTGPAPDPGPFQIGSITKVFTGTLLALLVRRKAVRLDTPIGDLIDRRLAAPVAAVTLLELATHTAGFPQLPQGMRAPNLADPYATFDRDALLGFVAALQGGSIVDGRGSFGYSNFGVAVLGTLLASVAGRSYEQLLADELFEPLGMARTFVATANSTVELGAGMNADGEPVPAWTFDAFAPCGAVVSTAADVLAFARALCEGASPLAEAMREAAALLRPVHHGASVGLCWMGEGTLRWHNGQTFGHHAMLALDLEGREAAVALWDAASSLDDVCFHLVRPSRELTPPPREVPLAPDEPARYAGTYDKSDGGTFAIVADERGLSLDGWTPLRCRLYNAGERRFFCRQIPNVTFSFEVDPDGSVAGMELGAYGITVLRGKRRR